MLKQHTLGQRSKTYYTVQVPCKAYIAKYVRTYYGTIRADSSSLLGMTIALSLDKQTYEKRNAWYEKKTKGLVTTIGCDINQWQFDRLGFNLPKENIMLINRYLEEHFEEELYLFCKYYTTFNPNATGKKREVGYKDAIETFARQYNISIEEDISFEGLKRKELRCRNKHEQVPEYVALPKQLELFQ